MLVGGYDENVGIHGLLSGTVAEDESEYPEQLFWRRGNPCTISFRAVAVRSLDKSATNHSLRSCIVALLGWEFPTSSSGM